MNYFCWDQQKQSDYHRTILNKNAKCKCLSGVLQMLSNWKFGNSDFKNLLNLSMCLMLFWFWITADVNISLKIIQKLSPLSISPSRKIQMTWNFAGDLLQWLFLVKKHFQLFLTIFFGWCQLNYQKNLRKYIAILLKTSILNKHFVLEAVYKSLQ